MCFFIGSVFSIPKDDQSALLSCLFFPRDLGGSGEQAVWAAWGRSLGVVPVIHPGIFTILTVSSSHIQYLQCLILMPQLQWPQWILSMPMSLAPHTPWPQPPWFQGCVCHLQTGITAISQALYPSTFLKWRDVTWGKEEPRSSRGQGEAKRQQAGEKKGRKDELTVKLTLLTHNKTPLQHLELTSLQPVSMSPPDLVSSPSLQLFLPPFCLCCFF